MVFGFELPRDSSFVSQVLKAVGRKDLQMLGLTMVPLAFLTLRSLGRSFEACLLGAVLVALGRVV